MFNSISNIDTLIFLVDIDNYQENCKSIIEFLKIEKEKAILNFKNKNISEYITSINKIEFALNHSGTKGYSFILQNDYYQICIAEYHSSIESFKPIKIRISSEALWSLGFLKSYEIIRNWIEDVFGEISKESVYRVDLCNHSNLDFITNYKKIYKGKFKKNSLFYSRNDINSICFGSRKNNLIYCRIYNKTLEINETKNKQWFKEIWKKQNLNINNVWNLEFEIKSEFLRSKNISTVNQVFEHLQDLWRYCTEQWLVQVIPNKTRISRCSISKQWLEIQNAFNDFSSKGLINKDVVNENDSKILIPTISGYITSYSANLKISDIDKSFEKIKRACSIYYTSKNTTFSNIVEQKMKVKGDVDIG